MTIGALKVNGIMRRKFEGEKKYKNEPKGIHHALKTNRREF